MLGEEISEAVAKHSEVCMECMENKPTGISIELAKRWRNNIPNRDKIEATINSLKPGVDWTLIKTKVCESCTYDIILEGEEVAHTNVEHHPV